MNARTARLLLPALALGLGACDVFDPSLYRNLELHDMGGADASPDLAPAAATLALADRCEGEMPTLHPTPGQFVQEFIVDTSGLHDDFSDLVTCTAHAEPGNDGFFAIDMLAEQRWHIHVKPLTPGLDPAIYVIPTCDERACSLGNGEDECGPGRDEHMSFIAPTGGRFIVGVDARMSGGGLYDVLAVRPICGDGIRDHSESCDDGNTISGDGCDSRCRAELSGPSPAEVEPNDDLTGANVLPLDPSTPSVMVHGRLGGHCDFDMYLVNVPAGGSVHATLLDPSGAPCGGDTPPMTISFVLPDGHTVAGQVGVGTGGGCPAIGPQQAFANSIQTAGAYYIRVTTAKDEPIAFDYGLKLELH
jgi:cysteine-rich repeat protein